jgi:hypothetical protein
MPELGPYGSVRGARGNSRPYRESWISTPPTAASGAKRSVAAGRISVVAFIEMGAGYVAFRISDEVMGELNWSAKTKARAMVNVPVAAPVLKLVSGEPAVPHCLRLLLEREGVNLSDGRSDSQERCGLCR